MIDHIDYEASEGLKNNLSSKFGYFWLLYLRNGFSWIFYLKDKVKMSCVVGKIIRLVSEL